MNNNIYEGRDWAEFETNRTVGVVTTIFSEQMIENSYNIIPISPEKYEKEIELYDIDTIFIDNDLFESDHAWYRSNRTDIVKLIHKRKLNLCVIKNTHKKISKVFTNPFIIELSFNSNEYTMEQNKLICPILIDSEKYNPVHSSQKKDIVYLSIGRLEASEETSLFNKTLKPDIDIVNENKITRFNLKELFSLIKHAKLLFIGKNNSLDGITLKYIEIIANIYTTNVIYDHSYNTVSNYSINYQEEKENISMMQVLLKNPLFSLKSSIISQRHILINHTFILKQNIGQIITSAHGENRRPKISVITSTNRKENLEFYIKQMNNQLLAEIELNVVTHGFKLSEEEKEEYKDKSENPINFIYSQKSNTLGRCLNLAVEASKYETIAKIDDDDYYLEHYLFDQWIALQYSRASVVGKKNNFYYFEKGKIIAQSDTESFYTYDSFIRGASIIGTREIVKKIKFKNLDKSEDTDFLRRVVERGEKIFVGHPFEMCVYRAKDNKDHTWDISNLTILKGLEIVGYGDPVSYIGARLP